MPAYTSETCRALHEGWRALQDAARGPARFVLAQADSLVLGVLDALDADPVRRRELEDRILAVAERVRAARGE